MLWVLCSATAAADESASAWRLLWQAPSECPSETWFRGRVDGALGSPAPETLAVDVEIVRGEAHYTLSLHTSGLGADGQRTLEGARCDELSDAAAAIVAISFPTPDAAPSQSPVALPTPEASASNSRVPEPPTRATPKLNSVSKRQRPAAAPAAPSAQSRAAAHALAVGLGVYMRWQQQVLPAAAFEFGVNSQLRMGSVLLGLGVGFASAGDSGLLSSRVDFVRYSASGRAGFVMPIAQRFELAALGTIDAALLSAARNSSESALNSTLAVGLGPALFWRPLPAWSVSTELGVAVSPRRATLHLAGADSDSEMSAAGGGTAQTIWTSSLLSGWAGLGVSLVF